MAPSCSKTRRTNSYTKTTVWLIALITCQLAIADQALSQDISQLAFSDWETTYQTPRGAWINANVYLRGSEGFYINQQGMRGILSDITYHPQFDHRQIANIKQTDNPPTPAITGTFNLHGATGFFVFRAPDRSGKMDGYSGSWTFIGGDLKPTFGGGWDGVLKGILPNPNAPIAQKKPDIRVGNQPPIDPKPDPVFGQKNETSGLVEAVMQARAAPIAKLTPEQEAVVAPNGWIKLPVVQADGLQGANDPAITDQYLTRLMTSRNFVGRVTAAGDIVHPYLGVKTKGAVLGTGFLVGNSLMLTSNHVVPTAMEAPSVAMVFEGGINNDFPISEIVYSSKVGEQDFSLLRLRPNSDGKEAGAVYGYYHLSMSEKLRKALYINSYLVNVIHYPRGEQQRSYEIRGRRLLFKGEEDNPSIRPFVAYDAGTQVGSSGAPVFNDLWCVVALHKGEQQFKDDKIANIQQYRKGIRIDVIIDSIRANCIPGVLKELGI